MQNTCRTFHDEIKCFLCFYKNYENLLVKDNPCLRFPYFSLVLNINHLCNMNYRFR